jgi:four helix bundle protein
VTDRSNLADRFLEYGVQIIKLVESLPKTRVCTRIGDQLLSCGTSVGANYEEAQGAESKNDFIHKLQISLKELGESNYWLRLIAKSGIVPSVRLEGLLDESNQLRAMLSKAVATAKGKAKTKNEL